MSAILVRREGKQYVASVNGQVLVGRDGKPRRFRSEGTAREAAELDAWLREQ
jgi:hypothetical protein